MGIRSYQPEDRQALEAIAVDCFGEASSIDYSIEQRYGPIQGRDWRWRKRRDIDHDIDACAGGVLVAVEEGEPVGFITARTDGATGIGRIPNLAVRPEFRGKGWGRRLMDAALEFLREQGMTLVKIETLETNPVGREFYPSYGFSEVARQVHYVMPLRG